MDKKNPEKKTVESFTVHSAKPNVWYSFSIAPNDANQFFEQNTTQRVKQFIAVTTKRLKKCPFMNFNLYLDISSRGRLHWHGWIKWDDNEEIFNHFLYNQNRLEKWAQIEIDVINDNEVWDKYVKKICHLVKRNINKRSVLDEDAEEGIMKYFGNKKSNKYDKELLEDETDNDDE